MSKATPAVGSREWAESYDMNRPTAEAVSEPQPVQQAEKLFDITAVIGSVYAGGDEHPRAVAFKMIAEYSMDIPLGEYFFPGEGQGEVVRVAVDNNIHRKPEADA